MAKSYYGYVKRDVENQIDWASITKEMVTTLEEEQGRREKKKADIDKASREFGKVLTDAEGSSHKGLNEFWLDSSSSIQELRRMQDDLLKRGLLDYKSYVAQRQNLTDGSDELINLVKGFDSKWTAVKDDPNASSFDYWNIGNIQGFGNFSDYKTWANPTDGKLSLGKIVLNPKTGQKELSNNPTEYQQVSFLKNRMNQRAPKYDYDAAIKKVTENVGRYVKAKSVGAAKTIEDVTKSDAYQKQINTWIDAIIENPFNAASILTDTLGYAENYTDDDKQANEFDLVDTGKTDKDGNPIMMKSYKYVETEIDPVQKGSGLRRPKLKEEQKDQLREAIRNEIESRLDYIETAAPRDRPNAYEEKSKEQQNIDVQNTTSWGMMYYGTPEQQKQGADRLLASPIARREDLIDIDVRTEPGKVILRYKDSTKNRKIDMLDDDGNPIPYADFVSLGNELHGVQDYGKAVQLSGRSDAVYNIDRKGRATRAGKANLYGDPETLVTYGGERNKTPKSIIEEIPNEVDKDVVETVSDVFSLLNLPKPAITTKEGGEQLRAAETKTTARGTPLVVKPAVIASPSLEITFPGVSPISIPEGEDFQLILDNIIEVLDTSFKSNLDISIDEIKAAFPTLEIFELYNPGFAKKTTEAGEKSKKPLPGKKE